MSSPIRFNVGTKGRTVRVVLGLAVLAVLAVLAAAGVWRDALGGWGLGAAAVVGGILVVTAAFKFCPAYLPFGLSTRPAPPAS